MASEFPECEKMSAIRDKSQVIGEFIEWMKQERGLTICSCSACGNYYVPTATTIEQLLLKFFDIDQDKVETERRSMLNSMRETDQQNERK